MLSLEIHLGVTASPQTPFPTDYVTLPVSASHRRFGSLSLVAEKGHPRKNCRVLHSKHAQAASPPCGRATLAGRTVSDVADPGFVWSRRREALLQQVRRDREAMARIRRSLELALLLATQAKFPPQPDDPVTTGVESLRDQFRLQTQWPVGFTSLDVGSLDGDLQSFIVLRALRWRAVERRIKSAARHIEDAAQQAKRVFESHRLHERVPGSDSLAKYAVAFFRTSFSIRSTASSLRSLATSASSSATLRLPGGAFGSVPRLAALTQLASVPLGIKIRCAASSSVNPCASTSLTASARNSGVYVVDFMFSLPLTSLSNGSVRRSQATSVLYCGSL